MGWNNNDLWCFRLQKGCDDLQIAAGLQYRCIGLLVWLGMMEGRVDGLRDSATQPRV